MLGDSVVSVRDRSRSRAFGTGSVDETELGVTLDESRPAALPSLFPRLLAKIPSSLPRAGYSKKTVA